MSTEVRLRRGTTAEHAAFSGALAEVTVDTEKKTLVVHDGATAGGFPIEKLPAVNSGDAGKALTVKSDESGYELQKLLVVVANSAALRAVDTAAHDLAYFDGSIWKQVDYADVSIIVTADTIGGYAVQSTQNPLKAWVRQVEKLLPRHFGAAGDNGTTDDYDALATGIGAADAAGKVFHFPKLPFGVGSRLVIPPTVAITSDRGSTLKPALGSGLVDGPLFAAGNALGEWKMPQLAGFTGIACEVRCNLARIHIPQFNGCGRAVKFNGGVDGNILDSVVDFEAISGCDVAVEFAFATGTTVIQDCGIRGDFITNTNEATVVFSGVAGFDDGLFFKVRAVDFTAGGGTFLDNRISGHTVPRFTAEVTSWFGGNGFVDATPTKLAKGKWVNCDVNLVNATAFDQAHLTPDDVSATRWRFRAQRAKGSAYELATTRAGFNSGDMIYQTEFMAKITLGADLPAGGVITRYFYHILADGNYYNWQVTKGEGGTGAILQYVQDASVTESGRVIVSVLNTSGTAIPAGTVMYFSVRRN